MTRLTAAELRDLRTLPRALLELTPAGNDAWLLRPKSRVGTVVLPSVRLLIRPKAGMRSTLYLLASAFKIDWSDDRFPYDVDDLMVAIAWWFDREVERAARCGLVRDYVERHESLATIRGRVAFERQLATRPGQRIPVECRFQDYSEDTPLNRLLKAAHHALLRMPGVDPGLARRLRHRARLVFGGVESVEHTRSELEDLPKCGPRREWEAAAGIARLILTELAIRDRPGRIDAFAFTVDMNLLFQRYVADVTAERVVAAGCRLEVGRERALTVAGTRSDGEPLPAVTIKPDLVVVRDGVPVAVGDVKYKLPGGGAGWRPGDAYQLIAYCVRLGLAQGLLVLCSARPLAVSRLLDAPLKLATIGVDLSGSPAQIKAEARAAADVLVSQADRARRVLRER